MFTIKQETLENVIKVSADKNMLIQQRIHKIGILNFLAPYVFFDKHNIENFGYSSNILLPVHVYI